MKVNFNVAFIDHNGNEMKESVKETVCQYLFVGQGLKDDGDLASKKYKAYKLMRRIADAEDEVEIEDTESLLIKEVCGTLAAGAYGQIIELLK